MKAWAGYVGLGLVAYLVFMAATFPAARAYPLLKDSLAPLSLDGVDGTIWSGRATTAGIGPYALGSLTWQAHPLKLLLGKLEFAWTSEKETAQSNGVMARGLGGTLYLSEMTANIPMAELGALVSVLPIKPAGMLRVKLGAVEIADNNVLGADGMLTWENAALLMPQPVTLGSLAMTLDPIDSGGVKGTLLDKGGALQAQGVLMLKPDGTYQFSGTLASRDPGQPQIQQALAFLGQSLPDGKVAVTWSGTLPSARPSVANKPVQTAQVLMR